MALSRTLTPEIAAIIEKQSGEIQAAHDRIRTLRDATVPSQEPPNNDAAAPADTAKDEVPRGI